MSIEINKFFEIIWNNCNKGFRPHKPLMRANTKRQPINLLKLGFINNITAILFP